MKKKNKTKFKKSNSNSLNNSEIEEKSDNQINENELNDIDDKNSEYNTFTRPASIFLEDKYNIKFEIMCKLFEACMTMKTKPKIQ